MTIAAYSPTGSSWRLKIPWPSRRPEPTAQVTALPTDEPTVQVAALPTDDVWSRYALPPWASVVVEGIVAAMSLDNDWDGAGGIPASLDAARAASMVLVETMADDSIAPNVVPTSNGGLQLEWHVAGVDLEVYIEPGGQVSAWFREGVREWEEDRYPRARLTKELGLLTRAFCE